MSKVPISKKVDGNELDLSMSEISNVPVKELKPLTKVTQLDLSHNVISKIPDDFCKLTNLVSIDLSNNFLVTLPSDFGGMQRLQKIDLYNNKLTSLPLSFCYFKNLKWLDVKDNPLDQTLKQIAGDCLDDKQCKKCAVNVVAHMKKCESQQQQKRQIELKLKREQERISKIEEEKERRRLKSIKLLEKNARREQFLLAKTEKEGEPAEDYSEEPFNQGDCSVELNKSKSETKMIPVKTFSFQTIVAIILLITSVAVVTLTVMCNGSKYKDDEFCISKIETIRYYSELMSDRLSNLLSVSKK